MQFAISLYGPLLAARTFPRRPFPLYGDCKRRRTRNAEFRYKTTCRSNSLQAPNESRYAFGDTPIVLANAR